MCSSNIWPGMQLDGFQHERAPFGMNFFLVHFFGIEVVYISSREALECDKLAGFSFNLEREMERKHELHCCSGNCGKKPFRDPPKDILPLCSATRAVKALISE